MGFKSTSTRRTSAASAVSSQSVVVNTSTGFAAVGATIKSNTSINLGVTTVGQTSAATTTTVSDGPVIGNVQYLDANNAVIVGDIAVSTAGGNILINGSGFTANSAVYVNSALVSNTFIDSTQIRAVLPAASSGNVNLMIFTPTNVGTVYASGVRYSGIPNWTTSAVSMQNGTQANVALVVAGDSTLTYTLQVGSTLPTGISLNSAGYLTGTPIGYSVTTVVSPVIVVTDAEGQASQQTVNITVASNDVYFNYNTLLLNGETAITPFTKDASTNNFNLVINGDVRPSRMTPYTGYSTAGSMYVPSAVTNYLSLAHNAATTIVSGATDTFIAECWVYFTSATATTAIMDQSGQNTVTFQNWSLNLDSAKKFQIIWGSTGSPGSQIGYISGTTVASSNTWYHLAYVKTNAVWSLFVNGAREATFSGLNTANDGTQNPLRIGSDSFSSQSINGYIADVRIYKGASAGAPYDANSSNITVPTAPLTSVTNTQLLTCQYNGGVSNNGFIDSSTNNAIITRNGNATQGSFSPFSPIGWSNYFNGSTDYFTTPGSASFACAADFTIEFWINLPSLTKGPAVAGQYSDGTQGTGQWLILITTAGKIQFYYNGSLSNVSSSATNIVTVNTWNHVAIVRSGSTITSYVNGAVAGSFTSAITIGNSTNTYYIANYEFSSTRMMPGYISNFRLVNGTAVYTSAFTPPVSPLTAVANTALLTCQSNRFKDNSTNTAALTVVGTPSAQATGPFGPNGPYSPSVYGGSAYFDGTGDNLSIPANTAFTFGTGDFTIEFWVYSTSTTASIFDLRNAISQVAPYIFMLTQTMRWYVSGGYQITSSPLSLNTWHHVAVVRSSAVTKMYLNGTQTGSSYADTNNYISNTPYIGGAYNSSQLTTGYISDLRVIKGTALYTTTFTPPTAPLTAVANTQLLCNFTNAGIADARASAAYETVGGAQLNTVVKKFGTASLSFNGTTQYLTTPYNVLFALESCDFTIEAWVYRNVIDAEHNVAVTRSSASNDGWNLRINSSNTLQFYYTGGSTVTSTGTIPATTWTHVAVTRSGTTVRLFINGTIDGSATFSNGTVNTQPLRIGVDNSNATGYFNGYIDDLRITKGYARYTANFTPPTSALLGQ